MSEPLLPTPAVNDMGDGKSPEWWSEWTAKMKAKHGNGNGHGLPLSQALSSASSPEWADSIWRWNRLGGCVSDRWRSTSGAVPNSNDTGRLFPVGEMSRGSELMPTPRVSGKGRTSGRPLTMSTDLGARLVARLTSSAEASHVSPSPTPASARPRTTPGGSGPSSPAALMSFDPDGSLSRMSPDCSVQENLPGLPSPKWSGTWPRWGSCRDGVVFAHPTSVLPIDGNASSSLLGTPQSSDATRGADLGKKARGAGGDQLQDSLARLPTPTSRDWKDGRDPSENVESNGLLGRVIPRLLPTPRHEGFDAGNHRGQPDGLPQTIKRHLGDHTNPPSKDGAP